MNRDQETKLAELIEKRLDHSITDEEMEELEAILLSDQKARRLFLDLNYQSGDLEQIEDLLVQEQIQGPPSSWLGSRWFPVGVAAAGMIAVGAIAWFQSLAYRPVATLLTSEHARWSESSLPTALQSALPPGKMKLDTGIATIQFNSGATMTLEAPAHIELISPMKANLLAGSAVIEVPERAIGFVVETPNGYAVDHGTAFSVSVDEKEASSTFEVITGEISVHHPESGESRFLETKQQAKASKDGVEMPKTKALPDEVTIPIVHWQSRLKTWGKEATIMYNNKRGEYVHPDFLMASRGVAGPNWARRSVLEFRFPANLPDDKKIVSAATLRLNLVPCGIGSASHLPPKSSFALYGIPDGIPLPENWHSKELQWQEIPDIEACKLLGRFEISRGQSTGNFAVSTPELAEFINLTSKDYFRFVLVRENTGIFEKALVHAFASSRHPEAAGPLLEVEYAE